MSQGVLYVLAAKGLQDFILRGDKLRLMVGGSELIEDLPNDFLSRTLALCGVEEKRDYYVLSRAAGGARVLFVGERADEHARRLASVMPPAVSLYAPGLEIVQDVRPLTGGLATALSEAERAMQMRRNLLFASYPVAGPLVDRAPRSGLPVVGNIQKAGESECADAAMRAKDRAATRVLQAVKSRLLDKMLHPEERAAVVQCLSIPENLEHLATDDNSYLAVLHADANGLGKVVTQVLAEMHGFSDDDSCAIYAQFSSAIATATERALQSALLPVVQEALCSAQDGNGNGKQYLPFRPLVCAGDDITVILRASDAVTVARRYLEAFAQTSREELHQLVLESLPDEGLSAAAGIVFVKKKFPFSQAYNLCESLCGYAKTQTSRQGASLAFWRVTTSITDDFREDILQRERLLHDLTLTMMPYGVGGSAVAPPLEELLNLVAAVQKMPRGSLRGLVQQAYRGKAPAQQAFERMRDIAEARERHHNGARMGKFTAFENTLQRLTGQEGANCWMDAQTPPRTPLYDALELYAAQGGRE